MKQFIVQMQDEVLREVGTSGSDYLRGEQVGKMKITGADFGEGNPWTAGKVEHEMETTGFSPEESEWGRRAADNLLWKMWDAASSTAPDDAEFIRRIDEVAEEEKNWATSDRVSYGVGSLMDSRSTSTNAFGYTVSRWIKKQGGRGGHWRHDYKSEIEDKLAEVSRGHGGYSDWRKHGRSPRKELMFEINDRVAEAKFDRLREYINKRKKKVGDQFPLNELDHASVVEYDALKERAAAQAGPLARLFGDPHKFKLGIYSTAKVYDSLDAYRRATKPLEQRVAEYQGADPLSWTGEKHSKHFEKLIRDTGYDAELSDEHKRLKVLTKGYRERVEGGGAAYSEDEWNEIIRFRELNQGLLAQRGKGEVVTSLAKQIEAEKHKIKEARKVGFNELRFPHTDAHRDLLKRYEEAKRGNVRMNFRSGMGSVAAIGARVGRWAPWEEGEDFDKRKKQEKRTEKARTKYMDPDGTPKTDPVTGLPVAYWRRNAKGRKIPEDYVNPLTGEMNQPLYGRSAFTAWQADEYKIGARKEYEASDVYKDLQRQKEMRERMHKINSVATANEALRRSGYSEEEIKKFGIGFTTMSKKERSNLLEKRGKLAEEIEQKKILLRQGATAPGAAPGASLDQVIRDDEMKLAAMDLQLDHSERRKTPKQLEKTHDELNKDFSTLFKIREKMQTGGRLGKYHESEYDVVSGEIEAIKKRRRDDQRVLTDKQIMRAAAGADGMHDILLRNGIDEEDAHAVVNGVPVNKVASGAKAKKIKDLLMQYGPPRIRPKDYAAALRGPQSNFGRMEVSTEKALRGKRKDLFMDATKLEHWIRNVGGGNMTEQEFLEVYSQMDMKTRARTKTALKSLTSRTIGEGIMYGGTGLEGQVQLGEIQGGRPARNEQYRNLLGLAELKDDTEKIKFIKNLITNDGLGAYMTKNPQNQEEMTEIIDNYWDQFVREVDIDADGQPDKFEALPGLQNGLIMDLIKSKTMDPAGLDWEHRGAGLIDKQAREDRKAKYVKDLARTRKLAQALTGPSGSNLRDYIQNHPNRASLGDSPALNLLASGQADSAIPGMPGATNLHVLSALQKGNFMAQFMHLDPSQRSRMLGTLQDLKVYNGGESLLDEGTKKRIKTQILKDQGITLDYTGQVALNRKDFDSTDDFFRAKDRRRDDFLAEKAAARQQALDARGERIKFGDPERRAREARERDFRINRDADINARVAGGHEPLRELENLATGFIPNLAPPQKDTYAKDSAADLEALERDHVGVENFRKISNVSFHKINRKGSRDYERDGPTSDVKVRSAMEKQYDAWQESGQRIPGPTNKFQPEYPGQIPRRTAPPIDPQVAKDQQYQDILQSRMVGEFDPITGLEKGDWDYRGYMKMGDTPAVPGSKVLPSLIKGREAQKGEEWFSISQQSGSTGQWIKGSTMKGRTLQLGNQQVEVVGTQGENIQVKTAAGEILTLPLRGQAAMAASQEARSKIADDSMSRSVKQIMDGIYGADVDSKADKEGEAARQAMEDAVTGAWSPVTDSTITLDKDGRVVANGGGFIPNFSPKGQSAVVNEITANNRLGQRGVKTSDVGFVKLNAGRGRSPIQGTMVEKGRHAEDLVKTEVGDFVVPAGGQRAAYASRLQKQADAAGLHGLPAAVMGQANAQGFIPNLQDANVGIGNVEEMRGLVERFEGTAQQIATTITEGSMEISHALNIEGKVAGLDQGQLIDALQGAMNETASIEAGRQIGSAFNDNTLNSEVAPPPTDVPRFNRPGNS